jgi:integrase
VRWWRTSTRSRYGPTWSSSSRPARAARRQTWRRRGETRGAGSFVGRLGDDLFGDFILRAFHAVGVETTAVRHEPPPTGTTLAFVEVSKDGNREFRVRRAKVAEGQIGTASINKTLTTLAAVLEQAVEHGLIERNPAKGKRRRVPSVIPRRTWIDRADHIEALLDGASRLDGEARRRHRQRRALLVTLTFAGLRISELLGLRWRDVDLARGTLAVRDPKTDAGMRTVDLLPVLRDELLSYRALLGDIDRDALVFATYTGGRQSESNIRRRLLAPAVEHANEALERVETELLPTGLTPHSLRRTFASLLIARGEDPVYMMRQLGHTDPEPDAQDLRAADEPT